MQKFVAARTKDGIPGGLVGSADLKASRATNDAGRMQKLHARIQTAGDTFCRDHDGGSIAGDIIAIADQLDARDVETFSGINTFPALMYDAETQAVSPTSNLTTLTCATEALTVTGRRNLEDNAPGTNSSVI